MNENNRFLSSLDNLDRSSSFGNDGSKPKVDSLNNISGLIRHPMVAEWVVSGADVSELSIVQATERLINLAQNEVAEKPNLRIVLWFAEEVLQDVVVNEGKTVRNNIQSSWPQLLNWAAKRKGFGNSLLSQDRFERSLVTEYVLLSGLKTVNALDRAFEPTRKGSKIHNRRVDDRDRPSHLN